MQTLKFKAHDGSDFAGVFFITLSIFTFGVRGAEAASKLNRSKVKGKYVSN